MEIKFIILMTVCALAVAGIVVILVMFRKKIKLQKTELEEIIKKCVTFVAIVESIPEKDTPVLIFRNAENNATIIHKYKSFGLRKFDPGDMIQLFYNEADDKYFVADDNEYLKKMFDTARNSIICTLIIPIILLVTSILLFNL